MRYEMRWEEDSGSSLVGLRWVNQPNFFPITNSQEAYLMGHDLLEHFTMNDCSQEAEIFSIGAMARVRGEEYFCYINHPSLSGWALQDCMKDGLTSSLEEMWSYAPLEPEEGFFKHLGKSSSYWQTQANEVRLRNCELNDILEAAGYNWKLSKLKERSALSIEPHQQFLLDHMAQAVNFAKLGYAMACRKYRRYDVDKMAQQYKAINKVMQKLFNRAEFLTYEGMDLVLTTMPGKGKARLKPQDEDSQRIWESELGQPFIEASAFEYVRD